MVHFLPRLLILFFLLYSRPTVLVDSRHSIGQLEAMSECSPLPSITLMQYSAYILVTQSVSSGPAAPLSPASLLDMQILRFHPGPTE